MHKDCDVGSMSDAEEDELLFLQGHVERVGKGHWSPTLEAIYNHPRNSEGSPS